MFSKSTPIPTSIKSDWRSKVDVLKVRTMNVRGKKKRMGRFAGQRPDWKKAIVTLKKGQTIEYFEGA